MGQPQPEPSSRGFGQRVRAEWLLLAPPDFLPVTTTGSGPSVRSIQDPAVFRVALLGDRPRLVLVCIPPGTGAAIELVASERRRRGGLRAVLVNGRAQVQERLGALRLGFDEAFGDDVDRHELDERLSLLAQHARSNGASHRLGVAPDVFLDLDARELRVRGESVHLRPKEFGLMQALARHPGRTFTRRQLLNRAWGTDHDGDPRTVDVHVRWLREKLEAHPDRPQRLVTVRGVGYRLVAPER